MPSKRRTAGGKVRRISYESFREAVSADACCAGAGADTATVLAALIAKEAKGTRPAEALDELLSQGDGTPVHGVWHHVLVGELLLVCLRNAGHPVSEELIDEAIDRGRQIPGGACGFLGVCGALSSAVSACAILLGSTPAATGPREQLMRLSATLAARLSEIGGSRCCKKSSYVALQLARDELATIGFELPQEELEGRCRFFASNDTCDEGDCPYFPTKRSAG